MKAQYRVTLKRNGYFKDNHMFEVYNKQRGQAMDRIDFIPYNTQD